MDRRFSDAHKGIALIGVYGEDCARIVTVNRALADLLAATPEDLVGSSICERIHAADRNRAVDELLRLIGGAASCEAEGRMLANDGRVRWVRVFAALLPPGDIARPLAMLHFAHIAERDEQPRDPAG